jgi:hypothetical protein
VEPLATADPFPPLGSFPLPSDVPPVHCGHLRPGETLVLHTDGAEDARDARGRFFSLSTALSEAVRRQPVRAPQAVIGSVFTALLQHTGGVPADDIALLALRNERQHRHAPGARRTARQAPTHSQPTMHR